MGNVVCALLRMWCRNGCNARVVASRLAFYPPQPPFYRVVDPDGPAPSWEVQNFRPSRTKYVNRVNMLQTRGGDKVACFVFRVARARSTLLYSHGNATDCGAMAPHYSALAIALKVNVVAYDYCGYGSSTGTPTDSTAYECIDAVYDHITDSGICTDPGRQLVIYGQSIGSGPSCYVASRRRVAGVILHSPFTSAMRVITDSRLLACFDMFPNIDRISNVQAPVFIIHGQEDEEVPFDHGKTLHEACPKDLRHEPWWVPGASHNDIVEVEPDEYFRRLQRFIRSLQA